MHFSYSGYTDLNLFVIDEGEPEEKVYRKCAFPGCISYLNQNNVKRSPFCHVHQKVVNHFIREKEPSYAYRYFASIIRRFENKEKKKNESYPC